MRLGQRSSQFIMGSASMSVPNFTPHRPKAVETVIGQVNAEMMEVAPLASHPIHGANTGKQAPSIPGNKSRHEELFLSSAAEGLWTHCEHSERESAVMFPSLGLPFTVQRNRHPGVF